MIHNSVPDSNELNTKLLHLVCSILLSLTHSLPCAVALGAEITGPLPGLQICSLFLILVGLQAGLVEQRKAAKKALEEATLAIANAKAAASNIEGEVRLILSTSMIFLEPPVLSDIVCFLPIAVLQFLFTADQCLQCSAEHPHIDS